MTARFIFFLLLFSSLLIVKGQNKVELSIHPDAGISLNYKRKSIPESELATELNRLIFDLYERGYLSATIDSIRGDSLHRIASLHAGPVFNWIELKQGNADEMLIEELGIRDELMSNQPVIPTDLRKLLEKILTYCENTGYPFATVKLDSLVIADEGVSASLNIIKNNKFLIDSITVYGNAKITSRYLQNYISIKPGDHYSEERIKQISQRILELPFLKEKQPSSVIFSPGNAKLILWLDDKKASSVNGVLGLLPEAYDSKKTQFVGDARLRLLNPVGRGELLDINWRKLQSSTNDLKVNFNYPFLFNTPFGTDLSLKIYKRDTTFIDINQVFGLQYILKRGNFFNVFIGNQRSSLISTRGYEQIRVLPNFADISVITYGIGYKYEKLDYRLNPSKGISIEISGSAGKKEIRKNAKINPVAYESLSLLSVQYRSAFTFDAFIPLSHRNVINMGIQGAALVNNTLFQNELYRIGGMNTLRGFDEESINASSYAVLTVEYRFLLEQNSYFHVFFDGAWYENQSLYFSGVKSDMPFGFGTGLTFETKAGIFSLSYALGKQLENPILIKSGKVHFGFVNYF